MIERFLSHWNRKAEIATNGLCQRFALRLGAKPLTDPQLTSRPLHEAPGEPTRTSPGSNVPVPLIPHQHATSHTPEPDRRTPSPQTPACFNDG
ncbi:hypothetical protein RCH22_003010 [Cryobacterium psychrotolerans]|nr:hypothetical protein [Cryobacterium psychrotolerans]